MSALDFEEDVPVEGPELQDSDLRKVSVLVQRQVELEASVAHLESELKKEKERLRKVAEVELPELLVNELNVSMFALGDGTRVEVTDKLLCSVPKKNMPLVAKWLVDNNHGAIVKNDVTLPFDKGETEKVAELSRVLEDAGFSQYSVKESVHTGQLKKLIQELEEAGEDVPLSLFGAYHHKTSKVSVPK